MRPAVSTCQPTSSRWSFSPSSVVGCAVPSNASHSACLMRSRFAKPAFGHGVAAVERVGRLVRVRMEAEAVHQRPRPPARPIPGAERAEEADGRRRDVVPRGRAVVPARREPDADDGDRRDRRPSACRMRPRGTGRSAGAEAFAPVASNCGRQNAGWFGSLPIDELLDLRVDRARARRRRTRTATASRGRPRSRAAGTGRRRGRRAGRPPSRSRSPGRAAPCPGSTIGSLGTKRTPMTVWRRPSAAMSPYSAAPPSSANFAESSFAPTSAATRDATLRPGAPRRDRCDSEVPHPSPPFAGSPLPAAARSLEPGEERVKQTLRAEANGIVRRQAGLAPRPRRSRAAAPPPLEARAVLSAMHATFAWRPGARCARAARRARAAAGSGARDSPRSRSSRPRGRARRRAAPSRGRARASRPSTSGARASPAPRRRGACRRARAPSTTSRSAAPARKSATTASTAMPQPAIAIPVWPVGTKTDASPRRRASRSSSTATVFFPIAQSEPTVRTIVASTSRFAPVGTFSPSGGLRRSRSLTPWLRASSRELGIVGDELVEPALDVEARRDAAFRSSRHAGGKRPPCVATPTTATVGSKRSASLTLADDRDPARASLPRARSRGSRRPDPGRSG